jgi:hypothetical protein
MEMESLKFVEMKVVPEDPPQQTIPDFGGESSKGEKDREINPDLMNHTDSGRYHT